MLYMDKIKKILNFLTEFSYLGAIFSIPLYFSVFFPTDNIFELNKLILFKTFVLFLFLTTFTKIILFKLWQEAFVCFNKKFIFIGVFLITLIFPTLLAVDSQLSYFGLYSRFQGLETYFYYILFFILVYVNLLLFQSNYQGLKKKIKHIVWAVFASSSLVSLYAIFQYFGYDYFIWAEPALLTKRAFSSLGQPNYLASFLLLAIPLSVYLIFDAKKFLQKFFIFLLLFFQISALFFSGSRGGFLGFVFICFVFVLFFAIPVSRFLKIRQTFCSVPKKFIFIFLLVFIMIFLGIFNFSGMSDRFAEMKDIKSGSSALRLEYWKYGLEAVKKSPLFGYGLDAQRNALAPHYKKEWAIHSSVNTVPHRAHNLFLDILLTTGLFGLIGYVVLLYLFFSEAIKIWKKNKEFSFLSLCLLVGVSGYLVSLFVNFAVVATQVYFWLFMALILVIANYEKIDFDFSSRELSESKIKKTGKLILILIFLIGIFYQINQELKYLKADYYFKEMKSAFVQGSYFESLEYWKYIKEENSRYNYYKKDVGLMIADLTQQQKEGIFRKPGEIELAQILPNIKNDSYFDVLLQAEIQQTLGEVAKAEQLFLELLELSPEMPRSYFALAEFYHSIQDLEESVLYYKKALALLPDFNNKEFFSSEKHAVASRNFSGMIHEKLGDLYFEDKNYEMAEKYYQMALNDNPREIGLLKKIADTHYQRQDLLTAIWYNKHGMLRNPSDFTWPFVVGLLYQELGQNDFAFDYFQQALGLSPNNKFIQNELNKLSE